MQFDLDVCSNHAELFLHLRSVILSFDNIKETKNAKQTSYYDDFSAVCFLRVRQEKVRLSFANGAEMSREFTELLGDSKIVRFVEFSQLAEVDDARIITMLRESLLLNIEKAAIRELCKNT